MKNKFIRIIEVFLILCIIFSIYKISDYYKLNKSFKEDNREFENIISTSEDKSLNNLDSDTKKPAANTFVDGSNVKTNDVSPQEKIKKLSARYKNVIGRIIVPGTDIDFPIVKGRDNSFYLNHNYKNEYHPFGAVFMDARNSKNFSDLNTILYGHNVRSGHVFHDLEKFKDRDFSNEHREIIIDTPEERMIYEIIAVYTAGEYDNYRSPNYSEDEWKDFISRIDSKNKLNNSINLDGKNILTLSTCSDEDDRLVIHAVKI